MERSSKTLGKDKPSISVAAQLQQRALGKKRNKYFRLYKETSEKIERVKSERRRTTQTGWMPTQDALWRLNTAGPKQREILRGAVPGTGGNPFNVKVADI